MPLHVDKSDNIKIWSFGSIATRLYCVVRYIDKKGRDLIDGFEVTPSTDRTEATLYRDVPVEGILEAANIFPLTGEVLRGMVYIGIDIQRQKDELGACLCQGYVSNSSNVFFADGHGTKEAAVSGIGLWEPNIRGNPAAGAASFSTDVPANTLWKPNLYRFKFVCDANVADRYADLSIFNPNGAIMLFRSALSPAMTAGNTYYLIWDSQRGDDDAAFDANNFVRLAMPKDVLMSNHTNYANRLLVTITGVQVGDQASNIYMLLEEWISD